MLLSEVQPWNTPEAKLVSDSGSPTVSREEHPENMFEASAVILPGSAMLLSEVQPWKTAESRASRLSGRSTVSRETQPMNADMPIDSRPSGRYTVRSRGQLAHRPEGSAVTLSGRRSVSSAAHPENRPDLSSVIESGRVASRMFVNILNGGQLLDRPVMPSSMTIRLTAVARSSLVRVISPVPLMVSTPSASTTNVAPVPQLPSTGSSGTSPNSMLWQPVSG